MTSGRRAILLLLGGTLLLFLAMMVALLPSLRPYRKSGRFGVPIAGPPGTAGAPQHSATAGSAVGRPVDGPARAPAGGAGRDTTPARDLPALAVTSTGESATAPSTAFQLSQGPEAGGSVIIEPAPFQPAPASPEPPRPAAPEETAPPPPEAATSGDAAAGDVASEGPGAVAPVLVPPVVLKAAWVSYPESARKRRAEGNVEVRIHVAESGGVLDVALVASAGDSALDRAALDAARTLKFRPARLGSTNVAVWYNYRFVFTVPR